MSIIDKIFGSYSDRELKRIKPLVDKIEALRPKMQAMTQEEMQAKTREFKERLKNGETLDLSWSKPSPSYAKARSAPSALNTTASS